MSFKEHVRKTFMEFFIIVTCICVVMFIMGSIFDSNRIFGYEAFLSPLIYGVLTTIPNLFFYDKNELSIKKALLRNLFRLAIVESIVIFIVSSAGAITSTFMLASLIFSIMLVYAVVSIISVLNDKRVAREFNVALKQMQDTNCIDECE